MTREEALAILNGENVEKARKSPTQWEHALQVGCVRWFRLQYASGLIFAIPNGAYCGIKQASKLKAEGMTKGYPDLCIPMARKGYHGLFIEMKNGKKGVVRDEQKQMMIRLKQEGYQCAVCRSLDDFMAIVNSYFH